MIAMKDYLDEIQYAVENLLPIIWEERNNLQRLEHELALLSAATEVGYRNAEWLNMNADSPDDAAMAAGMHWETYFGPDKSRYYKEDDTKQLRDKVIMHRFSVDSLGGSFLQYAKQGISICHGGLSKCPNGRSIGTQFLKDVIWQGRNQALHWEERTFKNAVCQCFDKLSQELNPSFSAYSTRSMAMDILELLGWTGFSKFEVDMRSLA